MTTGLFVKYLLKTECDREWTDRAKNTVPHPVYER